MLEKLLENWLDNASERSYQPVFVQMLAADGYRVLHSTRHCTLEYGKDVLAVAPDGVGCVFQLKGDPRGRMSVNSFRAMQTQVVQMLTQRPSFPGFPSGPFRAYLVSNGDFNEEVQVAAREINDSSYPAKLELWSRGTLLDFCMRHASRLWPSEITDTRALLEIYLADAGDPLPTKALNTLLSSILSLSEKNLKGAELDRAVSSACWATGIGLSRFAESRNHYAVSSGWMLCWALIRAASDGGHHGRKRVSEATAICESAVLDSLTELWSEVRTREHLGEGNPLIDMDLHNWRISVLVGLLSVLAFAAKERKIIDESSLDALTEWLNKTEEKPYLWGEGAVAQLYPWAIFRHTFGSKQDAKNLLTSILLSVVRSNADDDMKALPTPHYSFEEIFRDHIGARNHTGLSLSDRETFHGASYSAELLLRSAVLLGFIDEAKLLWPHFTKLSHRHFEHANPKDYWKFHSDDGTEVTKIYPSTYHVDSIKQDIKISGTDDLVTTTFPDEVWLVLMWWQVAPHRLTSSTGCKVFEILGAA